MKFPTLTEMGHDYAIEEGRAGHRRAALDGYAAHLLTLKTSQAAARSAAAPPVATGSIKDRINFFNSDLTKRREDAEKAVRSLQVQIDNLTAKLERQGGRLLPNGQVDWAHTSRRVVYDHDAATQGLTQLHYRNGLIYTDAACTTKFNTTGMVTAFGGPGWAIYVMSETGNIHASAHSVGHRHHSSLLAGSNVAGAGEMRVLQGKLVQISNKSGHYAPAAAHFIQVLYLLQKRGVSLFGVKLAFKTQTGQQNFSSVDAFLADMTMQGMETDFEYAKMIAYLTILPFPQFQVLAAAQGWRWGVPADFPAGAPPADARGVVRIADGVKVPHRDVRKWLKSIGKGMEQTAQTGAGR